MKNRIVSESIAEFKSQKVNEENFFQKMGNKIIDLVHKVGNYFSIIFNGQPLGGVSIPTNIGLFARENKINNAIDLIPNAADKSIDQGSSASPQSIVAKRTEPLVDRFDGLISYPLDMLGDNKVANESLVREALSDRLFERADDSELIKLEWDEAVSNIKSVDAEQLKDDIEVTIWEIRDGNTGYKALMIWGAPGIGKTAIVNQVVKASDWGRVIDVQTSKMAPEDWMLPTIHDPNEVDMKKFWSKTSTSEPTEPDVKKQPKPLRNIDIPKFWLPVYLPTQDAEENKRRNDAANLGGGGVLFLDELTRADPMVQNTCLKLVDERIMGEYKLGSQWTIIAASNRVQDEAEGVTGVGNALAGRFNHINFVPTFEDWKAWALETDRVDMRILTFLEFNQKWFYRSVRDPEKDIAAPSPRTWEACSMNLAAYARHADRKGVKLSRSRIHSAVALAVGVEAADQLASFMMLLERYTKEDILEILKNPKKARLPKKEGSGYDLSEGNALMAVIVSYTKMDYNEKKQMPAKLWEGFVEYLIRLDNASLATVSFKLMIDSHPYMHDTVEGTTNANGEVMDKYHKGANMFIKKYGDIF